MDLFGVRKTGNNFAFNDFLLTMLTLFFELMTMITIISDCDVDCVMVLNNVR